MVFTISAALITLCAATLILIEAIAFEMGAFLVSPFCYITWAPAPFCVGFPEVVECWRNYKKGDVCFPMR